MYLELYNIFKLNVFNIIFVVIFKNLNILYETFNIDFKVRYFSKNIDIITIFLGLSAYYIYLENLNFRIVCTLITDYIIIYLFLNCSLF